MKLQNWRYSSV